jgi:hypothetical protein
MGRRDKRKMGTRKKGKEKGNLGRMKPGERELWKKGIRREMDQERRDRGKGNEESKEKCKWAKREL